MCYEDDSDADIFRNTAHVPLQCLAGKCVQGGERFIEKQHLRMHGQRAGQCDTLLLSARQILNIAVGEFTEFHKFEKLGHPGLGLFLATGEAQPKCDTLPDCHPGIERCLLKHHHPFWRWRLHLLIVDAYFTL